MATLEIRKQATLTLTKNLKKLPGFPPCLMKSNEEN